MHCYFFVAIQAKQFLTHKHYFDVVNKGNGSIPLFSKVINRVRENKSWLQRKTEGNTSPIRGKQGNTRNTRVQQKPNDNVTHMNKTNYKITTVIILTWYKTF